MSATGTARDHVDPAALGQLFTDAHTTYGFQDTPVSDETLHTIYDVMRLAPTSLNAQPLRITYVRGAAKDRLIPLLGEGNRAKTTSAPVAAILAYDHDFHEHLSTINPRIADPAAMFADADGRHSFGRLNGAIQVGYFIIAARAAGLDVGPMAGFDNAAVDAEFFADSAFRSLVVANLGYAAADGQQPRNPRLEPHQVFTIVNS
jgi:3-hydroxypropanoate dehydrogenase